MPAERIPTELERRRESRRPANGVGVVDWNDDFGWHRHTVSVINVAADGVQVRLREALPVRQVVRLSGEAWECLCDVRYCRPDGADFRAGLELSQPAYRRE